MKYILVLLSCLTFSSCQKEVECCSYTYWTTYNDPIIPVTEECSCCYDLAGRKINCP
jgi:hypothetical protein